MNAIDELVGEFAPVDENDVAERAAESFARRNLREAVARERRPRGRWRLTGRRWRLTIPLALAAGLAGVILVVGALLPGQTENAPAPASAAVVLERAARVAIRQPDAGYPGPHQYLYLKFREGWTTGSETSGEAPFAYQVTDAQQDWVAPNGSGRQRVNFGPVRFLSPGDRAAWVSAGRFPLTTPSIDGMYSAGGYPAGGQLDPTGLPTEPQALLRAIETRFERGKFQGVEQTFTIVGVLLQDSGSPTLRAALYRVVKGLPGVRLLGSRTDALGRHGVAVGVLGVDGVREELLFSPATSDVLESELVQAGPDTTPRTPGAAIRRMPIGTVLHYFVYITRGVVDSIEALPDGGAVPFHRG